MYVNYILNCKYKSQTNIGLFYKHNYSDKDFVSDRSSANGNTVETPQNEVIMTTV